MEAIPSNQLLEYNSDTLTFLRKQYELDKPGRMEEAIEILQDWLKKQDHIIKKNYRKCLSIYFSVVTKISNTYNIFVRLML